MSYKIVIAKPGFDATTETNPNNLIFSSDYNTLKYYLSGFYQMLNVSTTTNVTIAHNLGYVPFFQVFVNDLHYFTNQYGPVEYYDSTGFLRAARAYVDSTNLYLSLNLGSGTVTANWYYKIFKNNLGL
jgi:hypothetical protein